ncbi:MAG: acyl-CoA dehydrogenase [Thiomonas sp. 20-64-5]|nr:MAG: acyl-CoA dehydrogenase [Thiomonas sp. 20-64-5]
METAPSPRVSTLQTRLHRFLQTVVQPQENSMNAALRAAAAQPGQPIHALLAPMRQKAQLAGLWNLFLPASTRTSQGLSHWEYAPMIEAMGRIAWAAEVFNSAQPDTGNMQLLDSYASEPMKDAWLDPLLRAETRSAWAAAEPDADLHRPDSLHTQAVREGDDWVLNGHKTWVQGMLDPRTACLLVLCRTDVQAPLHRQFSVLLVPINTDGVRIGRQLHGWGVGQSALAEVLFDNARVSARHLVGQTGQGLEMLQARQRIVGLHEALWSLGAAERALDLMVERLQTRRMGEQLAVHHPVWQQRIAHARTGLDTTRMLARRSAWQLDQNGGDLPPQELAMLQSLALPLAQTTLHWSIVAHEADALGDALPLAGLSAHLRLMQQLAPPVEALHAQIAHGELLR